MSRDKGTAPSKPWNADTDTATPAQPALTPAEYQVGLDQKKRERQAAFDANKAKILADLRKLMGARKYEEASKYANEYYDVDNQELRDIHAKADQILSDAVAAKARAFAAKEKAFAKTQGVGIGMTKEQVLGSSWGNPSSVNATTTKYGTREQWVYDRGRTNGYLYFEGDTLTAIQN